MISLTLVLLATAAGLGSFGFSNAAGPAAGVAQALFVVFLAAFLLMLPGAVVAVSRRTRRLRRLAARAHER